MRMREKLNKTTKSKELKLHGQQKQFNRIITLQLFWPTFAHQRHSGRAHSSRRAAMHSRGVQTSSQDRTVLSIMWLTIDKVMFEIIFIVLNRFRPVLRQFHFFHKLLFSCCCTFLVVKRLLE